MIINYLSAFPFLFNALNVDLSVHFIALIKQPIQAIRLLF